MGSPRAVAQRTQGTCEWSARAHPSLCRAPTVLHTAFAQAYHSARFFVLYESASLLLEL